MIKSHYDAGTGALFVATREERRFLESLLGEVKDAHVATCAAPNGALKDARTGGALNIGGIGAGYEWAAAAPGRILVVHDFHTLVNAPGHWRALIEALPGLRAPKGGRDDDAASLVVFVAPAWELSAQNPLRGELPVLDFAPPTRSQLAEIASNLHDLNGEADAIGDALAGLTAGAAEQAAAECLAANRGKWSTAHLRAARRQALREAGLELWPGVEHLGGLSGFKDFCEAELFPWVRDEELAVRRVLCAGVPGVGKSYGARWLAHRLGCECARLSIPSLKGGLVGQSEGNLRRALSRIDALAAEAPLVVVLDEIDTIAREGLDGGTSSGMFAELLTWLQESTAQAVVVATLNRLDKLDAALESRFQARFFYDLPTEAEREAVALVHFKRLKCEDVSLARELAEQTEECSSREIAEHLVPSIARRGARKPTFETIKEVVATFTPASKSQGDQLQVMRQAAATLRRANDTVVNAGAGRRRVKA